MKISKIWSGDRQQIATIVTRGTIGSIALLLVSAGAIAIAGSIDNIDRADVGVVLCNTVDPDGKPYLQYQKLDRNEHDIFLVFADL